jgi:hypothetical protein
MTIKQGLHLENTVNMYWLYDRLASGLWALATILTFVFVTWATMPYGLAQDEVVPPVPADAQQPVESAPAEMKTVAVAAVKSYDNLAANANFLGSLMGMAGADQLLEAGLLQFIGDRGVAAIDKTRPWGVIAQTNGDALPVLAVIPVTRPDELLETAKQNGFEIKLVDNDVRELSLPSGYVFFAKPVGGWLLLAPDPDSFAHVPADIQAELAPLVNEYDLGVRLSIQSVPEVLRQMAMAFMRGGLEDALVPEPGQSDEELAARREAAEAQFKEAERIMMERDRYTLGLAIDPQRKRGHFDFTMEAVPESELAKQLNAENETRTHFAGFYQPDATATYTLVGGADPKALQENLSLIQMAADFIPPEVQESIELDKNIATEWREPLKAFFRELVGAMTPRAESGKIDGGLSMNATTESLTIIGGARAPDTERIVAALKRLEEELKKQSSAFPGIEWDAAQHADVTFHTLSCPTATAADESYRRIVGNELPIAIGIGNEVVYVALGRDHLEAAKKAIDASKAEPNKLVSPTELSLSVGPLMQLAAAHATDEVMKSSLQAVGAMVQNTGLAQNGGQPGDRLRMVRQTVPNGIRYRFEAEEGALRAGVFTSFMLQMQAMGR